MINPKTKEPAVEMPQETKKESTRKRVTLKVIQPWLPSHWYLTLRIDEGKISKKMETRILSTRDPEWSPPLIFDVENPKDAVLTIKVKRLSLFGLRSSTYEKTKTCLSDLINGTNQELLLNLKAEVTVEDQPIPDDQPIADEKEKKKDLRQVEQKNQNKEEPQPKQIKEPSFWVKHGFLHSKHRYTRRRFV
jgi:transcriptional regulator of met regulon